MSSIHRLRSLRTSWPVSDAFNVFHRTISCGAINILSNGWTYSGVHSRNTPVIVQQQRDLKCSSPQWAMHDNANDTNRSTYSAEDVEKFHVFAQAWWDDKGEAAALHTLNYLRVPFIKDGILQEENQNNRSQTPLSLDGFKLLDVGCGGGILSEALGRLGATVIGVDALSESIDTAKWHLRNHNPKLQSNVSYKNCLVEDLAQDSDQQFDAIVCSEVIEHVNDPAYFISCCDKVLKPGGSLFFTTMSQTMISWALAIVAAEYLFRIVPRGTHEYSKFITPQDLSLILKQNNMQTRRIHGMSLNPLSLKWNWSKNTNINYALHAVKEL